MTVMTLPDAQQLLAMPDSDYMNSVQRAFFRQLLKDERQKLLLHIDELKRISTAAKRRAMKPTRRRAKRICACCSASWIAKAACCRKSMRRWRDCRTASTATAGKPANLSGWRACCCARRRS